MKLNKLTLNNTLFHSITFVIRKKKYMLASGWALEKGDWWYSDKPENKKFFDLEKINTKDKISYGIYVGRLGLRFIKEKNDVA